MTEVTFRVVDQFPEPAHSRLAADAFADYAPSGLLSKVLDAEAAQRSGALSSTEAGALRIGAFRGESLVGWTFGRREGAHQFHMINSGVAGSERRRGIYTHLARLAMAHARSLGCSTVLSRHAANNNAVIIAKLKLGFVVSGFEYSEVYGPLVRLTCLLGEPRRTLYQSRSTPLRRADADEA